MTYLSQTYLLTKWPTVYSQVRNLFWHCQRKPATFSFDLKIDEHMRKQETGLAMSAEWFELLRRLCTCRTRGGGIACGERLLCESAVGG
jgi:hypothetical protein